MQLLAPDDGNWEPITDVFPEPLPTNRVPPFKAILDYFTIEYLRKIEKL